MIRLKQIPKPRWSFWMLTTIARYLTLVWLLTNLAIVLNNYDEFADCAKITFFADPHEPIGKEECIDKPIAFYMHIIATFLAVSFYMPYLAYAMDLIRLDEYFYKMEAINRKLTLTVLCVWAVIFMTVVISYLLMPSILVILIMVASTAHDTLMRRYIPDNKKDTD